MLAVPVTGPAVMQNLLFFPNGGQNHHQYLLCQAELAWEAGFIALAKPGVTEER